MPLPNVSVEQYNNFLKSSHKIQCLKIWQEMYVKELLAFTWKLILQFYVTFVIKNYSGSDKRSIIIINQEIQHRGGTHIAN